MFESARDASRYLSSSIITFKGEPCYIHDAVGGDRSIALSFTMLMDAGEEEGIQRKKLSDKGFDFSPVKLGYGFDKRGLLTYLARVPSRMWKQGLTDKNLRNYGNGMIVVGAGGANWKALRKVIKGHTDPIEKVLEEGGVINREFAIDDTKRILFSGYHIGNLNHRVVELTPEYAFMDRYIQEVLK